MVKVPIVYETVGGCDGRLVTFFFEGKERVAIIGEWGELQQNIKAGKTLKSYVEGIVPDEAHRTGQALLAVIEKRPGGPTRLKD
jgi:hypothetical protein